MRTALASLAARPNVASDADLAATAEHIERRAWWDIVQAAPPSLRQSTGLIAEHVGGALLLAAPQLDSLLFNRVIGLGEAQPADAGQVARVIDRYAQLGVPHYWVHAGPYAAPARLGHLLQRHGLKPYRRSWVKMMRAACRVTLQSAELLVRPADPRDATAIAGIVGEGFDLPQRGAELFAALIGRAHWHVYVATLRDEVAAAAALFIEGDVAYLAFAATRPAFRRRGAQRALMHARINRAADAGCQWIATETGFPLAADEPNPSYQNLLWAGFRPVAIRDNYAPQGTVWRNQSEDHAASALAS